MDVPVEIRARIEADVKKYVEMASKHFGKSYAVPEVRYNLRGTSGGVAYGSYKVDFNAVLLMENLEDFIARTVPHEVAHCIDSANGDNQSFGIRYDRLGRVRHAKRSLHGPSWQHIMRVFGVTDITRCHNYDVANAQVRVKAKFEYKCGSCSQSFFVSSVRHNKMQRGQKRFWCRPCGQVRGGLVYVQNLGKISYGKVLEIAEARKQAPAPTKEVPVANILKPRPMPIGNMAIAKAIMMKYGYNLTRQQFIVRATEAGIKATTASTYYNQLKPRQTA